MKTSNQISIALLILIFTFSGMSFAKKPADRIIIISKEGKIIEIFRKPDKLVKESILPNSLSEQSRKASLQETHPDFDITHFIKPENEINEATIDSCIVLYKIKAIEAQIK